MIRNALANKLVGFDSHFRYRGQEPGRLENFSDAIFALAITLLLISTSAPVNFTQIKRFAWEIIPFSLSIAFLKLIWTEHFTFFFRYGLRNVRVVMLNTAFLIIILFYVYPLKFLTRLFLVPIAILFNQEELQAELSGMIAGEDVGTLMIIYGLGVFAIFFVLMLMYRTAYSQADELELNEVERFDTRTKIQANFLMASVPLLSVLIAILFRSHKLAGMFSGFTYFLYTPMMIVFGRRTRKQRTALLAPPETDAGEEEVKE
jgi:uncharacterized membrane protein